MDIGPSVTRPGPLRRVLGLRARILLICGLPLVVTALVTAMVVHESTRSFVEDAIGEQMVMQARIASHLVAIADAERAAGRMDAEAINGHFKEITRFAKEHWGYDYEFWVTDSSGKVTLGSQGVEFTFSPDQPQAGAFLRLLGAEGSRKDIVVQDSRPREIDPKVYKYVATSGVDMPRIVQVGYRTESLMAALSRKNLLLALGVAGLLLASGVVAYVLLSRAVTSPLKRLVDAALAVEAERYEVGTLDGVRLRRDELGRLASVFEGMVAKLASRYEELVNFMRSTVLKVRGDGTISFANARASELFGFSRAELVGSPLSRIVPPEMHGQARAQLETMTDQDVHVDEVRESVTRSGRRVWMAWSSRLIRAGEGGDRELLYVGNDVTEEVRQKQEREELAERLAAQGEQLRLSEERSRMVLESTAEGIFGTDAEGRITFVNRAACEMLGFRADELVGRPSHEAFHHHRPDGSPYPAAECPMYLAFAEGKASRIDSECLWRKDGGALAVEYRATPMIKGDVVVGSVVSFADITERKAKEAELLIQHSALEAAANAITIVDRRGIIQWVNPAFTRLTGYEPRGGDRPEPSRAQLGGPPEVLLRGHVADGPRRARCGTGP